MKLFLYVLIMAGVTYLIRMLPLVIFRRKIKSPLVKNFLFYVPYAVLGAMTVPAVFYSTGSIISAAVGFVVAVILSVRSKSLIVVAASASVAAFAVDLIMSYVLK